MIIRESSGLLRRKLNQTHQGNGSNNLIGHPATSKQGKSRPCSNLINAEQVVRVRNQNKKGDKTSNQKLFEEQQNDFSPEIRTIMTKTQREIAETKELLRDKSAEKHFAFFETFLENDIKYIDRELFPVNELHMGELNPALGRRIHNKKLHQLSRYIQSNELSKSFDQKVKKQNPWENFRLGHRRCTGEPSYLMDSKKKIE